MSALVQHASDVILVIEKDGTVVYASPAVERVLGYAPSDLSRFGDDVVHPEHLEHAQALFVDALAHPGEVAWLELPLQHTDGSFRWFDVGVTNRLDDVERRRPGLQHA